MRKQTMKTIFASLLLLSISNAVADAGDIERNNLAKLANEIDFLIKRVDAIKQDRPADQRLIFDYGSLKRDLLMIRAGINEHISNSLKAGRAFEPVKGHYHKRP